MSACVFLPHTIHFEESANGSEVLLPEIVKAMRNDLQVDNPNMGKIKEPSLVDIKPYLQINKSKFQEN